MRALGVNATIMRVIGKLEQKKMRAIGVTRIGVAHITGFYCTTRRLGIKEATLLQASISHDGLVSI